MQNIKVKYLVVFLVLFSTLEFFLTYEKNVKIDQFLTQKTKSSVDQYHYILNKYESIANIIFNTSIQNKEVLELFSKANGSSKEQKDILRKRLHTLLGPQYDVLKLYNLKQLHFHLPNNDSFLRFHKPQKHSDNLTGIRGTVEYANTKKKFIKGFEEGRIYNGYRYVYPLFFNNKHIGSVETSFSTKALSDELYTNFQERSAFYIQKNVVKQKVFNDQQSNYMQSVFPNYLIEKSLVNTMINFSLQTISVINSKNIIEPFSLFDKNLNSVVTFYPVKNPVSQKVVGLFSIIQSDSNYYINKVQNYFISTFLIFLISFLFSYYLYFNANAKIKQIIYEKNLEDERNKAVEALKFKSEFLANMSHEIRTPMNAIIGLSFLVQQTDLDSKQTNYILKIDNASKHLLGIINDVLDYSKIEAGKMKLESVEFDFFDILENLSDMFIFKLQDKEVELLYDIDVDLPSGLIGDSLRLSQVFINIIGNAIKFTETGTIILKAQILSYDKEKIHVEFTIEDTGIGMTKDQCSKIFSTYAQADSSTTRNYGGTGLGLSISKYFINLMGGDIQVQSKIGVGTKFIFDVNLQLQEKQELLEFYKTHHLKVLIVDDNNTASNIIKKILKSFHYDTYTAIDANEAIKKLEQHDKKDEPFDLIIIDYRLPKVDGIEVLNTIKEDIDLQKQPKTILISVQDEETIKSKVTKHNADVILAKPFSQSTLYNAIVTIFHSSTQNIASFHKQQNENFKTYIPLLKDSYVLLVEDNEQNQEIAVEYLKKASIKVDIANNGKEALEMVQKNSYEAVLMDCQMPIMDGYTATEKIRLLHDAKINTIPIIAMTANAMQGDREKCIISGMDDYIAKPIDISKMYKTLSKYIQPKNSQTNNSKDSETMIDYSKYDSLKLQTKEAMTRMGEDEELYKTQLYKFAHTQKNFQSIMTGYLNSNDTDSLIRSAHTLKGLSAGIGSNPIFTQSKALESNLKSQGINENTKQQIKKIDQELCILIDRINTFINLHKTEETQEILGDEQFSSKLNNLKNALKEFDTDALEIYYEIKKTLEIKGYISQSNELDRLIEALEYDEAFKLLENIE